MGCREVVRRVCDGRRSRTPDCGAVARLATAMEGDCRDEQCRQLMAATRCGIPCADLKPLVDKTAELVKKKDGDDQEPWISVDGIARKMRDALGSLRGN